MSKFALIIGNSEFNDKNLSCLETPTADVRALAEVLLDKSRGGFDAAQTLINESESIIRKAIVRFFAAKKLDDLLLLYFSGHGVTDDQGHLYLAAQDTEPEYLPASAISANFITEAMDRSRSKRKVLILDCCHSGAFFRSTKAVTGAKAVTKATFQGEGYGKVVLTATDSTQYAWSGDDEIIGKTENSVFTHFLIEGLKGAADTNNDGRITLDELYDYVSRNIPSRQTPTKWAYNQQGELFIATNPFPIIKPAPLPGPLLEAIEDPRSFVREGAVRELERLLKTQNKGLVLAAGVALERIAADENTSQRVSKLAFEILKENAAVVTPSPTPEPQIATFEPEDLNAASEQVEKEQELAAREKEEERKRREEEERRREEQKQKEEEKRREAELIEERRAAEQRRREEERRREEQRQKQREEEKRREEERQKEERQKRTIAALEIKAEAAISTKHWYVASEKLEAILLLHPGHMAAAAKLKDVLKEIKEAQREEKIANLEREAEAAENREDWFTVIEKRQALKELDPIYPERIIKLENAQKQQQLADLYAEGQKSYATHDWSRALSFFHQVQT